MRDQFGQDKKTARLDKKFRTKMQPLIKDKEKREIIEIEEFFQDDLSEELESIVSNFNNQTNDYTN